MLESIVFGGVAFPGAFAFIGSFVESLIRPVLRARQGRASFRIVS